MKRVWTRVVRLIVAGALVSAVLGGGAPQMARAEDNAAEVPGVPWVGRSATGLIGAEVIDRVWRLELPEGRVGIFRVTGEAGAQLGLYLFGEGTTSVVTGTPLKSSAAAGATQRFTVLLPAGTYYINLNGRNTDRKYAYSMLVSLIEDPTPPFLSFVTANGKTRVSSSSVRMKVFASDGLSGVDALRWRTSGGTWSEWAEYGSSLVTVQIPESEGVHTVEMQARNGAQLVSPTASLDVTADYTAPIATLTAPEETTVVSAARPTITYTFNEAMDGAAWRSGGLLVYEFEGGTVQGTHTYDATTRTGSFRPDARLTPGGTYVVEFSAAADRAGNAPQAVPWSFTYLARTSLTAANRKVGAAGGESVRLRFRATGIPAGDTILLEELLDLGGGVLRWVTLRETTARGDGELQSIRFTPEHSGRYALRFPGSDSHQASRTASVILTLTPAVSVLGRTTVRDLAAGNLGSVSFRVLPVSLEGVSLLKYKCNADFSSCTRVETLPAIPDADGEVRHFWTAESGNWAWRLRVAASEDNEAAQTSLAKFRIR